MNESKTFKGLNACDGQVKAKAFIIRDISNLPDVPDFDYILIAPYTTPVINMFLINSKGIVAEMGGLTCHAAIIAREFSIPCVVGIKGIMEEIKDGQIVEINSGEVNIYE